MPRYFFHIFDDAESLDDEGMELADLPAARAEAVKGIRELICDQVRHGEIDLSSRIDIEDEARRRLLSVSFAESVVIRN